MSSTTTTLKLTHVIVYQNSALFKLTGAIHCVKGENTVVLDKLTNKLDKNSVRVKGTGFGRISNIIIEKKFSTEANPEIIKKLTQQRDDLQKKKNKLDDSISSLSKIREQREIANKTFATEFPKWFSLAKIKIEDIKEMDKYFKNESSEIAEGIRLNVYESQEVQKQINDLNNQISQLGYANTNEDNAYYTVTVVLDAEKASDFNIEANFTVSGAYWEPFYDIIIKEQKVEINLMANVHNQTGVDWNDINLDISTANIETVKMEKPSPFHINTYVPVVMNAPLRRGLMGGAAPSPKMEMVAQSRFAPGMIPMEDKPAEEPAPELNVIQANMKSDFGVQSYSIASKLSIPNSKNPKPLPLLKEELVSVKQYFWSVVSPDRVLCNNKIKNGTHLILPGAAKVYVGDEYIGETTLDLIAPNEEFKLGERVTYDIKIKKEMKAKDKEKEGLVKGKSVTTYKYEMTIENLKKVTEELIMYDRIPHSISEKIKVRIVNISDEPGLNEMNVLKFVFDMKSVAEKKILSYQYEVSAEKDVIIDPSLP